MKEILEEVIMGMMFLKRYFTERLNEKGKNDKRKELSPKLVKPGLVSVQHLAAEQGVFRSKKRGSARFGCFFA